MNGIRNFKKRGISEWEIGGVSKGPTNLKVFHIGNYTTEGQTDWILFYLSETESVKMKSDEKYRKEERGQTIEKRMEKHRNRTVAFYCWKCTMKIFRIRPIKNKHKKWISSWVVKLERNSYSNHVLGSRTISMREREKDTSVYWRNISKDVKETKRDL